MYDWHATNSRGKRQENGQNHNVWDYWSALLPQLGGLGSPHEALPFRPVSRIGTTHEWRVVLEAPQIVTDHL